MTTDEQKQKAAEFHRLHQDGTLVLANAWDPGSAVIVASAGAAAVATSSAGVSWGLGLPDGNGATREEMVEVIGKIVERVDIPVSADIENGYGDETQEVADSVEAVIKAGAVGINLEDSKRMGGPLYDVDDQVDRIRAARAVANHEGIEQFVINARTDLYLFGIGEESERLSETLGRANAYAQAGADVVFVPGVADLELIRELVIGSPIPINTLAGPGTPTPEEHGAAGVRRVSYGASIALAAYSLTRQVATEVVENGAEKTLPDTLDFLAMNDSFPRPTY
jgi:2-methylisocitrate lyase-like PEP mutase family enzyme